MKVEEKLMQETIDITMTDPMKKAIMHTGKPSVSKAEIQKMIASNYVPVVMQHIREHGCSGLKCKRCPMNNVCDRNASNSKELANQLIAYANIQRMKK